MLKAAPKNIAGYRGLRPLAGSGAEPRLLLLFYRLLIVLIFFIFADLMYNRMLVAKASLLHNWH